MKKVINPTKTVQTKIVLPIDNIPIPDWNTAEDDKMSEIKQTWQQVSLHSPIKKSVRYHQTIRLTSN